MSLRKGLAPFFEVLRDGQTQVLRGWYGFLVSKESLLHALEEEREKERSVEVLYARITALEQENETLRALSGEKNSSRVLVRVKRCEEMFLGSVCVLSVNAEVEVRAPMVVVSREGMVLGEVEMAEKGTVRVRLLASPNFEKGYVVHTATSTLSFQGRGMGEGVLEGEVPRDALVEKGDRVILPFLEEYTVGIVAEVRGAPEDATKTIFVRTSVPRESFVWVLLDK